MNEEEAIKIIGPGHITPDGLYSLGGFFEYPGNRIIDGITLDGDFTVEELEAFVWWMKNKS